MPRRPLGRIINFLDLGAGREHEKVTQMAARPPHMDKRRVIQAVDLEPASRTPPAGVEYVQKDALRHLRELAEQGIGVKVLNADNFFHEQVSLSIGKGRDPFYIQSHPILPEMVEAIKKVLVRNGRLYATTVRFQAEPLAKKLREAGFEVCLRALTKEEAMKEPFTTRETYKSWERGELRNFFGREGWQLYRIVAVKRG